MLREQALLEGEVLELVHRRQRVRRRLKHLDERDAVLLILLVSHAQTRRRDETSLQAIRWPSEAIESHQEAIKRPSRGHQEAIKRPSAHLLEPQPQDELIAM